MINSHAAYSALTSRDPRFDGIFFVGVTSTGVYCRPICPVKTPLQKNCRFFESAFAAEKASFRPCLRCRPELAPGHAPIDNSNRVAHLSLAGILINSVPIAGHLGEVLSGAISNHRPIIDRSSDGSFENSYVDE